MMKEKFYPMPEDRFVRQAILIRVVDGDTLDVQIDLGWSMKLKERIRLAEVDTPEISGKAESKAGLWVKSKVEEFFGVKDGEVPEDTRLILTSVKYDRTGKLRDHYCRTIAEVYRAQDGVKLNKHLLDEKLGWQTDPEGELLVDRSLLLLTGLPAELRG